MGSGSSCSLSFELFDNYLNTKNCCVTDHFNSDFELLPLQTTNINPVKAHFSLPVKLSESLSQFLVSYLCFSDFELLEGRPPIPTRLWPHCVLLSQEDISPALISSFQYRWWTKPILFSVRNIPGNPHISRKNNKERFALLKQKFKGRKEKIKEDGEHEEEENEEGEGVGGGESLERGGGELVADSERKRSSEGEVCWLASKRMMGIGHWPRENIFQPNCQILSNNPGFSHSKFFIKSKSHKHILLRKRMWNELCTCAQGPPATFQRMDQLSHILKPLQRLGPERWRWGGLKTLDLTRSKMHCCKSGTQAS